MNPWVISYTTMTILSLLGQFFTFFLYFKQKQKKTSNTSQDLLLRMAISDIFFCIAQLIIIYPSYRNNVQIRCDIYSIFQQFGTLSLCLNCFCLSYFSYLSFNHNEEVIKKYALYSVMPCYLIPLILAIITNSLGDSYRNKYTCFIAGVTKGSGAIEFFTTFYVPLIIFMVLSLYYVAKSIYFVNQLKKYHGECVGSLIIIITSIIFFLEVQAAEEILRKMMFYPVIFLISWLGYIIERLQLIASPGTASYSDEGLLVVLNDSQGFLNAVVYIINYYRTRKIFSKRVQELSTRSLSQKSNSNELNTLYLG